jgi:hypothetical protein
VFTTERRLPAHRARRDTVSSPVIVLDGFHHEPGKWNMAGVSFTCRMRSPEEVSLLFRARPKDKASRKRSGGEGPIFYKSRVVSSLYDQYPPRSQ